MKVAIAADHAGFPLKGTVLDTVKAAGHEPVDLGAFNGDQPDDYPDFAEKAGKEIQAGRADRGIVICGSGVGACIAANKMHGVYSCLCHDTYSAHQGVEHDQMNLLCLGARIIGPDLAKEIVRSFLSAVPSAEERHLRRVGKIHRIEETQGIRG